MAKPYLTPLERLSGKITRGIGSPLSIIVHTVLFAAVFGLRWFGYSTEDILLLLTTAVSLEAIYLAIFIQMTVNRNTESLAEVEEDIEEIHEDVEELGEDVDEIQDEVAELGEDVEEISENLEEDDAEERAEDAAQKAAFDKIESGLQKIIAEVEALKQSQSR